MRECKAVYGGPIKDPGKHNKHGTLQAFAAGHTLRRAPMYVYAICGCSMPRVYLGLE